MKINTEVISKMNPCKYRFDNWLEHYRYFDGDEFEFLSLDKISPTDKQWVILRMLCDENDLFTLQVFAIDCAFAAAADAAAWSAADAADAAWSTAWSADAAAYAAAYAAAGYAASASASASAAERERQVDCLIYLLENR